TVQPAGNIPSLVSPAAAIVRGEPRAAPMAVGRALVGSVNLRSAPWSRRCDGDSTAARACQDSPTPSQPDSRQPVSPLPRAALLPDRPGQDDTPNTGGQPMFIVATQDPAIRSWSENPSSGANGWGRLMPIDAGLTQGDADKQLAQYLAAVQL